MEYTDINASTIDRWCSDGWEWGKPLPKERFEAAKRGEWDVQLTPTKPVPHAWFGPLSGCRLLGLASGGAQQMPVFASLGANCTVLDYSEHQLQNEREYAAREGYPMEIIRADMSKPLPFGDESFDIIFHPVSNCYVRFVEPIWRECYRILKPGGRLLASFDNGINYLVDEKEERIIHTMPFDPLADPALMEECLRSDSGVQFSHTYTEELGGLLRAGFRLCDLYEDTNGTGRLHAMNVNTFMAVLCVKEG
ncbi:MAG: class I SAM-dependent methyltransferase [Clostridia bacterium]|nr:class I SAM-dependent methyltransferase [Clostridia bacterium]